MSDYLFNEGLRLAQSGHFQQAEQTLQTATLFKSGDVEILVLLAEVQAMQGHLSAAAATLAHAEEKSAGNSDFQKVIDNLRAVLKKFTPISQPAPAPAKLPPKAPAEKQPQASNPVSKSKGHKHRKNKRR